MYPWAVLKHWCGVWSTFAPQDPLVLGFASHCIVGGCDQKDLANPSTRTRSPSGYTNHVYNLV